MLTKEQIAHYDTFGFLMLRGVFSESEIAIIRSASLRTMRDLQGKDSYITARSQSVQPWLERHEAMAGLVDDDRIYEIGESICGPGFWLDVTEGHLRVGDTSWHGGSLEMPESLRWVKIAIYLDKLTEDDGCLRVVPGSHKRIDPDPYSILRENNNDPEFKPFGVSSDNIPSVALDTEPGDVIVFTEAVIHGAFGGGVGRHQVCLSFVSELKSDTEVDFVRKCYAKRNFSLHPTRTYINSDRPRIRSLVETPLKLGFEILEV